MPPGSSQLSSTALRHLHRRAGHPNSNIANTSTRTILQTSTINETSERRARLLATAGPIRPPPLTCHLCGHTIHEENDICPSYEGQQTADGVPVLEEEERCRSQRNSSKRVRSSSPELPRMRLGIPSNRITPSEQDLAMPSHASPSQPPPSSSQPTATPSSMATQQMAIRYPPSSPNIPSSHLEQTRELLLAYKLGVDYQFIARRF